MTQKTKTPGKKKCKAGSKTKKKAVKSTENKGVMIKDLGESILIEEDLQVAEKNLVHVEPEQLKGERNPKLFYRNFVFKCNKCVHEFEHEAAIPIIEHKIVCPKCNKEHIIRIVPVSKQYTIKTSD